MSTWRGRLGGVSILSKKEKPPPLPPSRLPRRSQRSVHPSRSRQPRRYARQRAFGGCPDATAGSNGRRQRNWNKWTGMKSSTVLPSREDEEGRRWRTSTAAPAPSGPAGKTLALRQERQRRRCGWQHPTSHRLLLGNKCSMEALLVIRGSDGSGAETINILMNELWFLMLKHLQLGMRTIRRAEVQPERFESII